MNTRVGKGLFEEKMANLKVFFAKDSISFTKTVKFSIEICSKILILIFIIPLMLRTRSIINISPNTRAIFHLFNTSRTV